jgi:hypothetical protein
LDSNLQKGKNSMKTWSIFLWVILFSSTSLFAQENDIKRIYTNFTTAINSALLTKSGSKEVSGFLSYSSFTTNFKYDEKMTQRIFLIEPVFLYFIVDNISFGLDLSYLNQKTDYKSSDGSGIIEQTFVGPVAKMYFGEDRFRPFIMADYLFLVGDNYDGGVLDMGAGIFYHVTGNFGISLFGKYGFMFSSNDNIDSQNRVFIGLGISNFIL